jgi:putative addiction module killer protein
VFTINTTHHFDDWYAGLKDRAGKARIAARIDRAEDGNFGDSAAVVEGVSEMRIHFGPGYRVYWKRMDGEIVILLAGGDKSTQQSDIAQALQLARLLKEK